MSTFKIFNEAPDLFCGTDNNNDVAKTTALVQPPTRKKVNKCRSRTQVGRSKILNKTMSQRKFNFKAPSKPHASKGSLYSSQRPVATPLNVVTTSANFGGTEKIPPKKPPPKAVDDDLWQDDDIGFVFIQFRLIRGIL